MKYIVCAIILSLTLLPLSAEESKEEKKQKNEKIIEEIVVTGKTPAQQPISSVSRIGLQKLEKTGSSNLSDIMSFSPGVHVSQGQKGDSSINIRGLGSNRVTLMYDGIPVYEPYFNSFNLNTFPSTAIKEIKVIKGASSVLYGPNTMGGVVNVITKRTLKPYLSLNTRFSNNSTALVAASGGYTNEKFAVFANATFDKSDGFDFKSSEGKTVQRALSNYDRKNFTGKFYFYPTEESEIMAEILYYNSNYGVPAAYEVKELKSRYWNFRDWDRLQLNLGGTTGFLDKGLLKIRGYYVHHYNVLEDYKTPAKEIRRWVSTYKNYSLGASAIGEYQFSEKNTLKFSLIGSTNRVRTQSDAGEEWEKFTRQVYSIGIEDHISLNEKLKITLGASVDFLKKDSGSNKTSFNPIAGIKFSASDAIDLRASVSGKSRFPSMKSLYGRDGNTDLASEVATNYEVGFTLKKWVNTEVSFFYNRITDMIQSVRGSDGYKMYRNVGKADLKGLEVEVSKNLGLLSLSTSYSYIKTEDKETGEPVDYVPSSQFNFFASFGSYKGFTLSLWGIATNESQALIFDKKSGTNSKIAIDGYAVFNMRLEKRISMVTLFVSVENLFNKKYFTEPGFPMVARRLSLGFNVLVD